MCNVLLILSVQVIWIEYTGNNEFNVYFLRDQSSY